MIDRYLSFSQIKTWLACRRQWAYQFRDGYKPKQPPLEFMRGSLLHLGMEHLAGVGHVDIRDLHWKIACKEWENEWVKKADGMIIPPTWFDDHRIIVDGACEEFRRHWRILEDDEGPLRERTMFIDLPGWKGLIFITDTVAEKLTEPFKGGIYSVDFKSFAKPKEEWAGDFDLQGAIYQRGLRQKGYNCVGSVLFELNTEPPKVARINKDGSVHQGDAAAIANWKPVRGQIRTFRSEEFLDGVWNQIVVPAAYEIRDAGLTDIELVPNMNYYGCKFCAYREPCQARLRGLDEAAILVEQFNKREKRKGGT